MSKDDYAQVPFEADAQPFGFADEFMDNAEPRCACVLLLDTSGSMTGEPIAELNAGLRSFKEALMSDSLAMKRVEVSVVTFGPVTVHAEFATADNFLAPTLHAGGDTPMGAAITEASPTPSQRRAPFCLGRSTPTPA